VKRFGEFIRDRRMEKKLNLKDVAGELGITVSHLSDIERKRRRPFNPRGGRDRYETLAKLLGLEADKIIRRAVRERRRASVEAAAEKGQEKEDELIVALYRKDHSPALIEKLLKLLREEEEEE